MKNGEMTFWEHLDELRSCIVRIIVAVTAAGIVAFCLKEPLFDAILAPCHGDFFAYRWMGAEDVDIHLVNTVLTEQMMIHLKMAFSVGCLCISPYILYVLFGFISPALKENERHLSITLCVWSFFLFILGVAINYSIIFPLTVRFLGTYQVSEEVSNMLTISSYIDTMLMMSIVFGIVFELPILSWTLGKLGLLKRSWMRLYRRHAIVAILIIAAIITPTSDAFTLMVVSLPIWVLYEVSSLMVKDNT